jgi:hypothetical protein
LFEAGIFGENEIKVSKIPRMYFWEIMIPQFPLVSLLFPTLPHDIHRDKDLLTESDRKSLQIHDQLRASHKIQTQYAIKF